MLSLHNLDSAVAAQRARQRRRGVRLAARAQPRRRAARPSSGASLPRADRVLCVSEADADAVRAAGGRALLAPNGVDDEFFSVDRPGDERARAVLRPLRLRGEPARRRALPRRGLAGGPAARARRRGSRSRAAGWTRCAALALSTASTSSGSSPTCPPWWRGARGGRADLGGRRDAPEGARGAGRRPGRSWRRRWAPRASASTHGRHGLLAETPARARRPHSRVCWADPRRAAHGRRGPELAERFRWKEALSGASAFYSRSDGSRPARDADSGSDRPSADEATMRATCPTRQRQTRRKAGTQSHGTSTGRPGCRKGQLRCASRTQAIAGRADRARVAVPGDGRSAAGVAGHLRVRDRHRGRHADYSRPAPRPRT